jgi:type IV pilus assembly protein PilA
MREKLTRGFTLIELMIVVAIIGILAAIAVPNFLKFQAKARQTEAKQNLKAIFTSVKSNFAENTQYTCGFCGWSPEKGNRYNYWADATTTLPSVDPASAGCATEAKGSVTPAAQSNPTSDGSSAGGFTASAVGNIDGDTTCDGWNINDANTLKLMNDDVSL